MNTIIHRCQHWITLSPTHWHGLGLAKTVHQPRPGGTDWRLLRPKVPDPWYRAQLARVFVLKLPRYLYQDFNGIILKVCCIGTPVWIYSGILHAGWGLPPPSPGCMTPAISFYASSCPNTEHRGGGPGTRQREENRAVKEPSRRLHSARGRSLLVSTPGWKCRILALSQSRIYWDTMLLRCFNTVSKCEIWTQTQWS